MSLCQQSAYLLTGSIDRSAAKALAFTASAFKTGLRPARDLLPFKCGPGQGDGKHPLSFALEAKLYSSNAWMTQHTISVVLCIYPEVLPGLICLAGRRERGNDGSKSTRIKLSG